MFFHLFVVLFLPLPACSELGGIGCRQGTLRWTLHTDRHRRWRPGEWHRGHRDLHAVQPLPDDAGTNMVRQQLTQHLCFFFNQKANLHVKIPVHCSDDYSKNCGHLQCFPIELTHPYDSVAPSGGQMKYNIVSVKLSDKIKLKLTCILCLLHWLKSHIGPV